MTDSRKPTEALKPTEARRPSPRGPAPRRRERTPEQREADRILERVARESESLGASSLARTASRTRDHFIATDADQQDPAEVWGKRIARVASLIAVIVLGVWLVNRLVNGPSA